MLDKVKVAAKNLALKGKKFLHSYAEISPQQNEWDKFYQRFEERFRGPSEDIAKKMEERYQARLGELIGQADLKSRNFIDLGCGRGEMLELAKSLGFKTHGVDHSEEAISHIVTKGHSGECGDLLSFLKTKPNGFALAISQFHVIEHCSAQYSWQVFKEAHRVLAPGGVLIVETPSLFSLWASQRQFFLDPKRERPVHPDYMKFMA